MKKIIIFFAAFFLLLVSTFKSGSSVNAQTATITFNPVADSYVDANSPGSNFGTSTQFRADGSPIVRSFVRFNVQGISGTFTSATLRIYGNSAHSSGFEVRNSDNSWVETTVNYNNQPAFSATISGSSGAITAGTWKSVNVTSLVSSNGEKSFAMTTGSSTAMSLASRESANKPELVIVYESGVVSSPTPTVPPTNTPTPFPSTIPTNTPSPTPTPTLTVPTPTPTSSGTNPTLVAASDIICNGLTPTSSSCQQMAASQVAVNLNPTAVAIVGDLCHAPSDNCFNNYYAPSWGRLFSITRPATGNHEYLTTGAKPYFDYWNGVGNNDGRAGERSKGYFSYNLGSWHIIVLNSQCSQAGGCNSGSAQYNWLTADLQNNQAQCTLAYWHIPVFSSGGRANNNMKQIFTLLYNNNADVVLNGHDHIYERFAPQNAEGQSDQVRGIREFIVGTGGANHTSIASVKPNSEVRNTDTFGALRLTLKTGSYDWKFFPVAGKTFTDSGSSTCH